MITHKGLKFKQWDSDDISQMSKVVTGSYSSLSPWMDWVKEDYTELDAAEWVRACQNYWKHNRFFAVYKEGELIGSASLMVRKRKGIDYGVIGYWVSIPHQRQGNCNIIMEMLLDYAFNIMKFDRVILEIAVDNHPSRKVAEKFNGVVIKEKPEYIKVLDKQLDAVIYEINKYPLVMESK